MTKKRLSEGTRDRELGLFTAITRRDVLHGMGAAMLGTLASPWLGCVGTTPRVCTEAAVGMLLAFGAHVLWGRHFAPVEID